MESSPLYLILKMWMANVISYDFRFFSLHLRPVLVIINNIEAIQMSDLVSAWKNAFAKFHWTAMTSKRVTNYYKRAVYCMFWQCPKYARMISLVVELKVDYPQITMHDDGMTMFNSSNTFSVSISWDFFQFSIWVWYSIIYHKNGPQTLFFYSGWWPDVSLISFLI